MQVRIILRKARGETMRFVLIWTVLLPAAMAAAVCPEFISGTSGGTVQTTAVREASGLAASRQHDQVVWTHNDSGDTARLYALGADGTLLGIYQLDGIAAVDWEDMALGPGPLAGRHYLYAGDIGDNSARRSSIKVHRVLEPNVPAAGMPELLDDIETITLVYPDGPRDAETLLVDPQTNDLYVVSKRETRSRIYRAAYPQATDQPVTMTFEGEMLWGWTTGGDISADGDEILIRGYCTGILCQGRMYQRPAGTSVAAALAGAGCPIHLMEEPQGEAICFDGKGCGYYTLSEGTGQPIYFFGRQLVGDLRRDCLVNIDDFAALADCWQQVAANDCAEANLDGANDVDVGDLAVLAAQWLAMANGG